MKHSIFKSSPGCQQRAEQRGQCGRTPRGGSVYWKALLCFLMSAAPLFAQPVPATPSDAGAVLAPNLETSSSSTASSGMSSPPASVFDAPGPAPSAPLPASSNKIPVTDARPTDGAVQPEIPDFHLTQVQLDGEIHEDRINLVVTIDLNINRGAGWHRVPLRLGSLHVTQRVYEGQGAESPEVSIQAAEDGLVWLFQGLGKHRIILHGWVPLKSAANGGQFQLAMPRLPAQFEARVKIRIPEPKAVIRSTKTLTVLDVSRTDELTTVDASVVGNLLTFTWQTPSQNGETIALVQSWFHLKPAAEHLSLLVDQNFELQQTTLDSVLVRLPVGFTLSQVTGPTFRSYERLADRPNWVRVFFNNDNSGRMQLRWVLERDFKPDSQTIVIEGFQVEGAMREEGLIRIDEFDNLRMVPRPADSPLVHRTSVTMVRSPGSGIPLTAYEYLKQPFQLTFDLQPTAPYFLVEPQLTLKVETESTELHFQSNIRIDRGSITELKLHWPDWLQNGWRVQSLSSESEALGPISYDATSQPGVVRLWWQNPLTQPAQIQVVFRRANRSTEEETLFRQRFYLPAPEAPEVSTAKFQVEAADQFFISLFKLDSTPFQVADLPRNIIATRPSSTVGTAGSGGSLASGASTSAAPNGVASESSKSGTHAGAGGSGLVPTYQIEDLSEPIDLSVEHRARTIQAFAGLMLQEMGDSRLAVTQEIELNVEYGRIRELEIVLPATLMQVIPGWAVEHAIEVTLDQKKLTLLPGSVSNFLRVPLDHDRKGKFSIQISFAYPVPVGTASSHFVNIPVINLNGIPFSRAELIISPQTSVRINNVDSSWETLVTSPRQTRWIHSLKQSTLESIPVIVGSDVNSISQQYVIQQLIVRSILSADGMADHWADFEIASPPPKLMLQFPASTTFNEHAILLNGVPVSAASLNLVKADQTELTIQIPANNSKARFSIRYRTHESPVLGLTNRITVNLPVFPSSAWVNETIWEFKLPAGEHVFTYPRLIPQMKWVNHVLYWVREPIVNVLDTRPETELASIPAEFRFEDQHYFSFRGLGPVTDLQFRVMNRSLLLLIGAGLALLLGFIFWKLPMTRSLFSVLLLGFILSLAQLWSPEPMALLLQPALMGIALAILAGVVDAKRSPRSKFYENAGRTVIASSPIGHFTSEDDSSVRSVVTKIYRPLSAAKIRDSGT